VSIATERYLTREQQFCSLCFGLGRGWVRVISMAEMVELRKGRSESQARNIYRARRRRRLIAHLKAVHPEVLLRRDPHAGT
jgi:hypothetical protein